VTGLLLGDGQLAVSAHAVGPLLVAHGHLHQTAHHALRCRQHGLLFQRDQAGTQLVGQQQGHVAPAMRVGIQPFAQRRYRDMQQGAGGVGAGVVGAGLAIEEGDLAQPARRLDQGQQGRAGVFLKRCRAGDAERASGHRIQAAGGIAAAKQPFAGGQQPWLGQLLHLGGQFRRQRAEPAAGLHDGPEIIGVDMLEAAALACSGH